MQIEEKNRPIWKVLIETLCLHLLSQAKYLIV